MQVLAGEGKLATSKSYMWLYATGTFDTQIFLYEYQFSRASKHPKDSFKLIDIMDTMM